ncbi:MAG: UbiD family decarboxylase [Deltaproteobacteria bacterium]|nr:UbiD family decarboxylase [Deltaproteobacteria bacterium]
MRKDLRTYLKQLQETCPKHVKVVDKEIDRKWEITALVEKMRKDPRYPDFPAVLFPNVKGSKLPVLINLCASYERLALSIDTTVKTMVPEYAKREANVVPPIEVSGRNAPVKEVIWKGDQIDLNKLPTVWHNEFDSGYYIDSGVSLLKDPDSGKVNAGIYRHEVQNSSELGFMSNPGHHGSHILRRMRELGKPLEVAIAIGHHPAFLMAAVSQLAGIGGELEACGGLLGEPLEVVRAETVDLMVPSRAEIVIEGVIDTDPKAMRKEGPFGEYPRYYTGVGTAPYTKITAITMRKDAIYQTVFNAHIEHTCLGALPRMGSLYRRVREAVPSVTMVNLPVSGMGRAHAYISLKKARDGEPKQVAFAAFAVDPLIKHVFVVDDDVDVFDEVEVLWCMCTRFQADRDLAIIPYALGNRLTPKSYDIDRNERLEDRHKKVMETKMILDLTKPAPPTSFPPLCGVPAEVVERVTLDALRDYNGLDVVRRGAK